MSAAFWFGGGVILLIAIVGFILYGERQRSMRSWNESTRRAAARAARREAELERPANF